MTQRMNLYGSTLSNKTVRTDSNNKNEVHDDKPWGKINRNLMGNLPRKETHSRVWTDGE